MQDSSKVNPNYSLVLKEFRDKNNYSQEVVAKSLGVRRSTISNWETGKSSGRDFLAGVRFAMLAMNHGYELPDFVLSYPSPPLRTAEKPEKYRA
jgi:transcriptional regulator with XRE-family HTH domain